MQELLSKECNVSKPVPETKPCKEVSNLGHGNNVTGIISIKSWMNKAHQNCFLDSYCTLTVMMLEIMLRNNNVKRSF